GTNTVLEYDNAGNLTRTFAAPTGSGADVFGAGFGESLAVTDDGALVVGDREAYNLNTFASQGEVYVVDLSNANIQTIVNPTPDAPTLTTDPDRAQLDQFGWAVAAIPGGKFTATDPTDDQNNGTMPGGPYDTGTAYLYPPPVGGQTNQPPPAVLSPPAT